jgi:threonine dehydratase
LAFAARARGVRLDVFAAGNANPLKITRMRQLGADVRLTGNDFDDAKSHARAYAEREGLMFVEDGRELSITEGAGSIAVELCKWPEPIGAILVPLGNGALLGGVGTWMKAYSPATRVIGVCAAGAPAMRESLRLNRVVETERAETIADGIAVRVPIPEALDYLKPVVDDVVTVTDHALRKAMEGVQRETGLVGEPAGVAGLAAVFGARPAIPEGALVATILCGSNIVAS